MTRKTKGFSLPVISGVLIAFVGLTLGLFSVGGFFGPKKIIYISFENPGPLTERMNVYYKGIQVGKITEMKFSDDYRYAVLKAEISKKDFNPPENIYAEIKIQGEARIWAQGVDLTKYVELVYPLNPSERRLKNEDTIEGRIGNIEEIEKFLKKNISQEELESSADNVRQIMKNAEKAAQNLAKITENLNDFLDKNRKKLDDIVANINTTTENTSKITHTLEEFAGISADEPGLRSSLRDLAGITKNLNEITLNIGEYTEDARFRDEIMATPGEIRRFICTADRFLRSTDATISNLEQKVCITMNDADRIMNRYDCIGAGLSDLLSERFLILKLLFGKPGDAFEACTGSYPPNFRPFNCCPCYPVVPYNGEPYMLRPYAPCPSLPAKINPVP